MDLELSLEKDGKMLRKIGFKKCGHRICMIKDPKECGICGKKYTKGTGKYYTSDFMDQIEKIVTNGKESKCVESDSESKEESEIESDTESDKESDVETDEEELEYIPKKGKRGLPSARCAVPGKKIKR